MDALARQMATGVVEGREKRGENRWALVGRVSEVCSRLKYNQFEFESNIVIPSQSDL